MTNYKVLQKHEAGVWSERADIEAASADAAVRAYVKDHQPEMATTYVAVPVRSFDPITVATETQTRVIIVGDDQAKLEPVSEPEPGADEE